MDTVPMCLAYLDANTGTMLLQIVVGGLGGLVVVFRLFWHRIRAFFSFRGGNAGVQEAASEADRVEVPEQAPQGRQRKAA